MAGRIILVLSMVCLCAVVSDFAVADYTEHWVVDSHNWSYWDGGYPENPMIHVATGGAGGFSDGFVKAPLSLLQPEHGDIVWPAYTVEATRDTAQNLNLNEDPVIKIRINDLGSANLAGGSVYFFIGTWGDDDNYVFWYYGKPCTVNAGGWSVQSRIDVRAGNWNEIVRVGMEGVAPQDIYPNPQQYGFAIRGQTGLVSGELGFDEFASVTEPAVWQMKQRDMHHTGRADFTVDAERMNDGFFDIIAWQKRSPDSPDRGNFTSTSMTFFDYAGPQGADIVIGGYHWPKGVQAMDRFSGRLLWYGNPLGGETIGKITPAFANDGATIYVVNDATAHPLMAFASTTGPDSFRHNGANEYPDHLSRRSPTIAPDGRVFLHQWGDRAYAGTDTGAEIVETWAAAVANSTFYSDSSLYEDHNRLLVVSSGRSGYVRTYDGQTGAEIWNAHVGGPTDASVTIDPDNGNIYVAAGQNDIYVAGLDKNGNPLWASVSYKVYDYINGLNHPQRVQATGCLSHDGATYYFQTNSNQGDGLLYAVNTTDGSLKWTYPTGSDGWANDSSCPIVTQNGVVVVGNNDGGTYYSIWDNNAPELLDTISVANDKTAAASATLSPDGLLYLPLCTTWTIGNGDGEVPTQDVENVFTAFDINVGATVKLAPPRQMAIARNNAVLLRWQAVSDPDNQFDQYAVYRSEAAFSSVEGLTPIHTIGTIGTTSYTDNTALNGTSYYYAVVPVTKGGGRVKTIGAMGPRTPFDETDLQIVSIARTPLYPRYCVSYTARQITEPSGFGPYAFKSATGLCDAQTPDTQRWPEIGDPVTYRATVRNRGTNPYSGVITGRWQLDGEPVVGPPVSQSVYLTPGQTTTFTYTMNWDNQFHDISFAIDTVDTRPQNNQLTSNTMAAGFLSYLDISSIEDFRESTHAYFPGGVTDDMIDWLSNHMKRFNEMFARANCLKRVNYAVLEVIDDWDPDPDTDRMPYAVFPFRYPAAGLKNKRGAYYHPDEDIDYGLLHEWAHQLGLIDIYQLNVPGGRNLVSGISYTATEGLMRNVATFLSEHSALAMNHWSDVAHGYFGQYMYCIPDQLKLRILGPNDQPLRNAAVTMYQYCDRPGQGKVITDQVKAQGVTDENGIFALPNVPIDPDIVPEIETGDSLPDNPFGYLHMVGHNGVLHFEVDYGGQIAYFWLDITEANVAYWKGQTDEAVFDRRFNMLPVVCCPPRDLTEHNAYDWDVLQGSEKGGGTVIDDSEIKLHGAASMKFITDQPAGTYLSYPSSYRADWDLSSSDTVSMSFRSVGISIFPDGAMWLVLKQDADNYLEFKYYRNGQPYNLLHDASNVWRTQHIPLDALSGTMNGWRKTAYGSPDISNIQHVEIHVDRGLSPMTIWFDGLDFNLPAYVYCDLDCDGQVGLGDLRILTDRWPAGGCTVPTCLGADQDQDTNIGLSDVGHLAECWFLSQ